MFWDLDGNAVLDVTDPSIVEAGFADGVDHTTAGETVSTSLIRLTGACALLTEAGAADTFTFDADCDGAIDATEVTILTNGTGLTNEAYTTINDLRPYAWRTAADTVFYLDINGSAADDATEPTFVVLTGHTANTSAGVVSNFVWSDSSADIHTEITADWANGFYVNAPSSSLSNVKKTLSL